MALLLALTSRLAVSQEATTSDNLFAHGIPRLTQQAAHPDANHDIPTTVLEVPKEVWRPDRATAEYYLGSLLLHLEHEGALTDEGSWPSHVGLEDVLRAFLRLQLSDVERLAWHDSASNLIAGYAPWIRSAGHRSEVDLTLRVGLEELEPSATGTALVLLEAAMDARLSGDLESARVHWLAAERALEALRERPDSEAAATRAACILELEFIGRMIDGGTPEQAVSAVARARAHAERSGSQAEAFLVAVEAMNLWAALDRTQELEAELQRFRRHSATWDEPPQSWELGRLEVRLGIGLAEAARARLSAPDEAVAALEGALVRPELTPEDRAMALFWLADAELEAGRIERAETLTEELRALLDRHDRMLERSWNELAILDAGLARAGRKEAQPVRARVLERLDALRARWSRAQEQASGRGLAHLRDQFALLGAAVELTLLSSGPAEALDHVGRFHGAGNLARALDAPEWTEGAWRALVPEGGGLLVFVPGAARSWVLIADAEGVGAHAIADVYRMNRVRSEIDRAWARLDAESRGLPTGRYPGPGGPLGEALGELVQALAWQGYAQRVCGWSQARVVAVESVVAPVLDLLPTPDGNGFLGARVALSYVPSLAVGLALQRRAQTEFAGHSFFALDAMSGLSLPAARAEAIERALAPLAARRVLPVDMGELTDEFARAGAAAFLGHGVDSGDPDRPVALLLHDEPRRLWSAVELDSLVAPGYVELIACGTWRGPLRRGDDGRQYLYGSLMIGGAHTVLTSQRPLVADLALIEIEAFHSELRAGHSPAEALRRVRAASPERHGLHPYLLQVVGWNSFPSALVHDADARPAQEDRGKRAPWFALVGLPLLGLSLWALLRRRTTAS